MKLIRQSNCSFDTFIYPKSNSDNLSNIKIARTETEYRNSVIFIPGIGYALFGLTKSFRKDKNINNLPLQVEIYNKEEDAQTSAVNNCLSWYLNSCNLSTINHEDINGAIRDQAGTLYRAINIRHIHDELGDEYSYELLDKIHDVNLKWHLNNLKLRINSNTLEIDPKVIFFNTLNFRGILGGVFFPIIYKEANSVEIKNKKLFYKN